MDNKKRNTVLHIHKIYQDNMLIFLKLCKDVISKTPVKTSIKARRASTHDVAKVIPQQRI